MNKHLRVTRCLLAAALLMPPLTATALPFEYRSIEGNFDTTLSAGASWRMQERSSSLVGIANGGLSRTVNDDDGNLNYDRGTLISAALKATHDLELKYDSYGLLSRVTYFYDYGIDRRKFPTFYNPDNSTRNTLGKEAKDRLIADFKLLDLLAYTAFDVGDRQVDLRVGNQVVNWGESTFIGNSINVINPVDVAQLRTPGAEIKEALKPSPMLWTAVDISDDLKMQALWISEFGETELDPRGSFFSTTDAVSDDGDKIFTGSGRRNDQHQPYAPPTQAGPPDANGNPTVVPNATAQSWLPRQGNAAVSSERRQLGLSFRYLASNWNDTEFGLYLLNYHNRTPLLSFVRGGSTNITSTTPTCAESATQGCRASYFIGYPENVQLLGLSFNTGGPYGLALQGEYSLRLNQPVQLATVELVLASLGAPNNVTGTAVQDTDGDPNTAAVPVAAMVAPGTVIEGFRRMRVHQLQSTATKAFGPTFGAQQFVVVSEVGINYQELPGGLLFAGPGTSLPAPGSANAAGGSFQSKGYATRFSAGYRAVSRLDYENVIGAMQMSPRLVFAHDVTGVGPNFNQGVMALQVGVGFNYLQRWQGDIGYSLFTGGRHYSGTDTAPPPAGQPQRYSTGANPNRDRDFLAASISYAF